MDALPTEPFRHDNVAHLGLTRARLRAAVVDGSLIHIFRGVYASSAMPLTTERRARAALLALTSNHVIVDRTAAWIYGIDAYALAEVDIPPPIDAFVVRGAAPTKRGAIRSGERDLDTADVIEIGGARVTTPLRTAMDLGCALRRREAYAVLNDFARAYAISRDDLRREVGRYRRRRGVIQLRELIQLVDPRIESPRESWVRITIHDASLPEPIPQHVVVVGDSTYRLDFAYPGSRVAVEYDGEEHHSSPTDREADRQRRDALTAAGWRFIVVRNGDFSDGRIEAWTRELRDHLVPRYTPLRAG